MARKRRRTRRAAPTVRRRRSRRASAPRGKIDMQFLMQGAGIAGGALVTDFLIGKIPIAALQTSPWARVAGKVGIAIAAKMLLHRSAPKIANALALGAIASTTLDALRAANLQLPGGGLSGYDIDPDLAGLMGYDPVTGEFIEDEDPAALLGCDNMAGYDSEPGLNFTVVEAA